MKVPPKENMLKKANTYNHHPNTIILIKLKGLLNDQSYGKYDLSLTNSLRNEPLSESIVLFELGIRLL